MGPSRRTAIIAAIVVIAIVLIYFWQRPERRGIRTSTTPTYTYRIVNTYPHDTGAFTQGLVFADGVLYEGTGLNGRSSLREVDLETGEV